VLIWFSFGLLSLLFAIGGIDGIYIHLCQLRLFARAESRFEHAVHTLRALLAVPTVWLVYVAPTFHVIAAGVLVAIDQLAMLLDVWVEPRSRRGLGGLPRSESLIHVLAITIHAAALALAFVARWQDGSPLPVELRALAVGTVGGTAAVALLHVLLLHPLAARWQFVQRRSA
jgi:hypothetical protein